MTPPPPVVMPRAERVPLLRRRWLWAASIMIPLLAGFVIYHLVARPTHPIASVVSNVEVQESFATVASSVDAQWGDANAQLQAGQRLPGIPLFLQSGVAEIRFDSGAMMIVEAPARFQVAAANSVELTSGQISAKVPASCPRFCS